MSEATDLRHTLRGIRPGWVRWLAVFGLLAFVFSFHYFRALYDLPDELGTIFYNAYLGDREGIQGALQELNSLSTYYVETGEEGNPKAVSTGFRFSTEGRALVVANRSLNSWVAGRIVSRVRSGAQLRADVGPKVTEDRRRKSWGDTSRELRRLGLTSLILRNDEGKSWQTELH